MSGYSQSSLRRKLPWQRSWPAAAAVCVILAGWQGATAQTKPAAPIPVELNKLEPLPASAAAAGAEASGPGCRAYIMVTNPDAEPITQLRLDLMLFNTEGIVARRVAVDLGPLAPHKTTVRLFDTAGQPCEGIGRVLVNDVLLCQLDQHDDAPAEQRRQACLDRLQLSSRAKAELTK